MTMPSKQSIESLITPEELRLVKEARARTQFYWWAQLRWRIRAGQLLDFEEYRYLKQIYKDTDQDIVYMKAAQLGFSEMLLALAFFIADRMSKNVGYFFPAAGQLGDFVQMRVDPAIEHSEYLQGITARGGIEGRMKVADKMGLKRVRNAFVIFRGAQNDKQITSVPLDAVILDEVDRFGEFSIPMIDKRMNNSELRWKRAASTPTIRGKGIDLMMQGTTKHQWHVQCKKCEKYQVLSYWKNIDQERAIMVCAKCSAPFAKMDIQEGQWIAKEPTAKRKGYFVGGLLSPRWFDEGRIKELVEAMNSNNLFVVQEAHNQDLGIPYRANDIIITDEIIDACQRDYTLPFDRAWMRKTYAGLDVGKISYLTVWQDDPKTGKPTLIGAFELHDIDTDVDYYMDYFDIRTLVMDGLPETHIVAGIVQRYPGRAFVCYYNYTKTIAGQYVKWYDKGGTVEAHRTASLDDVYGRIIKQDLILPKHAKYIPGFYAHFQNQNRTLSMRNGIPTYVYEDAGRPDHYAHSTNYAMIARQKVPADLDDTIGLAKTPEKLKREPAYEEYDGIISDNDEEEDQLVSRKGQGLNRNIYTP